MGSGLGVNAAESVIFNNDATRFQHEILGPPHLGFGDQEVIIDGHMSVSSNSRIAHLLCFPKEERKSTIFYYSSIQTIYALFQSLTYSTVTPTYASCARESPASVAYPNLFLLFFEVRPPSRTT